MNADAPPIAADNGREVLDRVARQIIGAAQRVSSRLGAGFVEKVYENALTIELRKVGYPVEQQRPVRVFYGHEVVGSFLTDLVVNDSVLVEIKATGSLLQEHHAQCLNYLRATGFRVCLLMDFGNPQLKLRRIVHNF